MLKIPIFLINKKLKNYLRLKIFVRVLLQKLIFRDYFNFRYIPEIFMYADYYRILTTRVT